MYDGLNWKFSCKPVLNFLKEGVSVHVGAVVKQFVWDQPVDIFRNETNIELLKILVQKKN